MAANEASGGNQAVSRRSCGDGHHPTLKVSFDTVAHAVCGAYTKEAAAELEEAGEEDISQARIDTRARRLSGA